ncbi:CheW-like domain-containing protein [Bordetella sputigena]|uniref:chemotaxis protein CheW n=1 Tax=Bordetella sputigena TaxID=1416810 RepID=UPI0039F132F1
MHDRDSAPIDDCWNRIGVRGDRSCPQLAEYVHCRECPVHEAAAKTLLYRAQAETGAVAAGAQHTGTDTTSLLIFRLHAEWLALPVAALAEVTPLRPIHSLPRRAGVVLGVCNVRGRLVPCVSLAALLDLAPRQDTTDDKATPRMLVLATRGGTIVTPVDEVAGIQPYPLAAIGPLPDTLAGGHYAAGVVRYRERPVGLLDGVRLAHAIEGKLA